VLAVLLAVAVAAAACGGTDEDEAESPCVAFAETGPPRLRVEALASPAQGPPVTKRIFAGAGHLYALDEGTVRVVDREGAVAIALAGAPAGATVGDAAVMGSGSGARLFVARWVVKPPATTSTMQLVSYATVDGGTTFDAASEKLVLEIDGGRTSGEAVAVAAAGAVLYVAVGGGVDAPGSLLAKILRVDPASGAPPEIWGAGLRSPRALDVDPETGDAWVLDAPARETATAIYRLAAARAARAPADRSELLVPAFATDVPDKEPAAPGGAVARGAKAPGLAGKYVYLARGGLAAIEPFGPSGTASASVLPLEAGFALGRGADGEIVVARQGAPLGHVVDDTKLAAPASLLATKCFDLAARGGAVAGAIPYDVTTPLWSDGAAKERFVVVPRGQRLATRADGDLVFPVGTVAVKSFAVDGRRVETRLLVQHRLESWVGYSYAWNAEGTDASLVVGGRVDALPSGKSWTFPSTADCAACHTPAAGYTLGLETRQLLGQDREPSEALRALERVTDGPADRTTLAPLTAVDAPAPATAEARARSYLHANCAMCHRDGSATGLAELDLRIDTPLARTGLCVEPKAGSLGLGGGATGVAHIVTPGKPELSVLAARMKTTDDRRMPKLASSVVDAAGLAAVEEWIRGLTSCP